jgi:hypothetical protein
MKISRSLESVRRGEQFRFGKLRRDELQSDRQIDGKSSRHGNRWHARETRRRSENVGEIHLHRVVDLLAKLESRGRRDRRSD